MGLMAAAYCCGDLTPAKSRPIHERPAGVLLPGMPPVVDLTNLYSEAAANRLSPAVTSALPRVYVPNVVSRDVYVIDPSRLRVVDRFKVGGTPQHVVPSWDLKTLWITSSSKGHRVHGKLMSINPETGRPDHVVMVPDAYNMYFMPNGRAAIVVAEALKRLEFRDPQTMAFQSSLSVPHCRGINHADFSMDGRYAIFTCEFSGRLVKIDLMSLKVLGYLKFSHRSMPQDIRISPDGKVFYVADMMANGVYLVDGDRFAEIDFISTGVGTHGLCVSRDGRKLYASNRGSHGALRPHGRGSVAVIDFATRKIETVWPIPGGGSPDMGNVSADGRWLWLSGRFDRVVYAIDTTTGEVKTIPVGVQPHGLAVWPQPGRYSLGHTGNMR
jgi:YVTN family beta-propeller protein